MHLESLKIRISIYPPRHNPGWFGTRQRGRSCKPAVMPPPGQFAQDALATHPARMPGKKFAPVRPSRVLPFCSRFAEFVGKRPGEIPRFQSGINHFCRISLTKMRPVIIRKKQSHASFFQTVPWGIHLLEDKLS